MNQRSLSSQQQTKLAQALKVARLAEEKASQMSELATEMADKYQQHLLESVQSASKPSE